MPAKVDQAFIQGMKKKVEEEMRKKEKEILLYWREELNKVVKRRHQNLSAMSIDLGQLLSRMDKRLSML